MGGGLALWREEHDEVALWTTQDSRIRQNSQWVDRHFSADVRYESVIVTADNVLTQDVLLFVSFTENLNIFYGQSKKFDALRKHECVLSVKVKSYFFLNFVELTHFIVCSKTFNDQVH